MRKVILTGMLAVVLGLGGMSIGPVTVSAEIYDVIRIDVAGTDHHMELPCPSLPGFERAVDATQRGPGASFEIADASGCPQSP